MAWLDTSLGGNDHKFVTDIIKNNFEQGSIPADDKKAIDVATKTVISLVQKAKPTWRQFTDVY